MYTYLAIYLSIYLSINLSIHPARAAPEIRPHVNFLQGDSSASGPKGSVFCKGSHEPLAEAPQKGTVRGLCRTHSTTTTIDSEPEAGYIIYNGSNREHKGLP